MWMDWNDPDELRRLRDLLAEDPAQVIDVEGPDGPGDRHASRCSSGAWACPSSAAAYFTFSNENNDLIWGFLAECHRRGWIYKGHDSMPWCPRCGTGLSQMEMNEGYQDREDPGLDGPLPAGRPAGRVAARLDDHAVDAGRERRGGGRRRPRATSGSGRATRRSGSAKGTPEESRSRGPFEVLEERPGRELVGWRYSGPVRRSPGRQRRRSRRAATAGPGYEHRIVAWDEVGEDEGTGIVHIAPGCGRRGLPAGQGAGPAGHRAHRRGRRATTPGFGWLSGREAPAVTEAIVDDLERRGLFYHLEPYSHRYPHCWRCSTPLLFRLVDEWFITMGPVYDKPRDQLTQERDRRQPSLPDHGGGRPHPLVPVVRLRARARLAAEHARLDDLQEALLRPRAADLRLRRRAARSTSSADARSSRERAVEGWEAFEGHTPHRPYVDEVKIACPSCGEPVSRIADVGNPWLDAGIVPFSTLHFREEPDYWAKWFPADFITESFPGQFRNWFYSMLAMGTVLRREPPFLNLFGYALVFGEDGRPMHKSWGNAIEFDEAAERMGVDVMRWLFASARPEDNINFGWHAADEARRELLVLWNVYAFLVGYARLAGWTPGRGRSARSRSARRWTAGSCPGRRRPPRTSRRAWREYDAELATRHIGRFIDDLSTWYLRLSRKRMSRGTGAERDAAFATLHAALVALARVMAPILPFLTDAMYRNLVVEVGAEAPDSVHLTKAARGGAGPAARCPPGGRRRTARRAVDLVRTLRGQAGLKVRQPLARLWLAVPAGEAGAEALRAEGLLELIAVEANVKAVELIGDGSELVDRRVKVLLPKVGKRLGARIPAVMAAAREGSVEIHPDGSVTLAGETLAPDEVEIQASPREGTAVAHDEGLVAVIDTTLTPALRAEGDARELQRAIQDLRKEAGLELDDRIDLWVGGVDPRGRGAARDGRRGGPRRHVRGG